MRKADEKQTFKTSPLRVIISVVFLVILILLFWLRLDNYVSQPIFIVSGLIIVIIAYLSMYFLRRSKRE